VYTGGWKGLWEENRDDKYETRSEIIKKNRITVTKSEIVVFVSYLATLLVVTVIQRSIYKKLKRLWKNIAVA
jgi:cell division protein FtsL